MGHHHGGRPSGAQLAFEPRARDLVKARRVLRREQPLTAAVGQAIAA